MELLGKIKNYDDLKNFDLKNKSFQSTVLNFLKRLLYLIETSNYNLQIILNQVSLSLSLFKKLINSLTNFSLKKP